MVTMRGEWRSKDDQKYKRESSRNHTEGAGCCAPSDMPRMAQEVFAVPVIEPDEPKVVLARRPPIRSGVETFKELVKFNQRVHKCVSRGSHWLV